MNAIRLIVGTAVGGIAVFITGIAIFLLPPLNDFYDYAMSAGSATGVARDSPLLWAVLIGALSYGALVTLVIAGRPGPARVGEGATIGATVGLLLWLTADFMFFGISNVGNLSSTLIDAVLELIPGAIAGGVIAAALDRLDRASASRRIPRVEAHV